MDIAIPIPCLPLSKEAVTYDDVLSNTRKYPLDRAGLLEYLRSHLCEEGLQFLDQVETYRGVRNTDEQVLFAEQLYATYIKDGAERQINIQAAATANITKRMERRDIDGTLFDEAAVECRDIIKSDQFPGFLKHTSQNITKQEIRNRYIAAAVFGCVSVAFMVTLVFLQNFKPQYNLSRNYRNFAMIPITVCLKYLFAATSGV